MISQARLERIVGTPVVGSTRVGQRSVLRCRLADSTTVIVKCQRDDPSGWRTEIDRLETESVALEFLASIDGGLAPRLVAAEFEPRPAVVVLEDLAPRESLRDIIVREGVRPALLKAYVRALARLHASTVERAASWPLDAHAATELALRGWRTGAREIGMWGAPLPVTAESELDAIAAWLPGAFLAFTNGDAGINNYLVDPHGDGRLIDFEFAGFQSVFFDLASLYVPGSMWLTVCTPENYGLEQVYRTELANVEPRIGDDEVFNSGVAGAAFIWALRDLQGLERFDARPPGDSSRAHRIAVLEAAANVAERKRCLPGLADWARTSARLLRNRWPDVDIDVSALPDYTSR